MKESFVEKMARKAFESEEFQKSWMVHMQAFGPILEPAFEENCAARVHLTAALNKISRRDVRGGMAGLEKLERACQSDADRAAWLFFMGLCHEMAGETEQAIAFYLDCCDLGHRFYLPYLRLAKFAHADAAFDAAEKHYRDAISCLAGAADTQGKVLLASAHTNLASCLTMMRRYREAEGALAESEAILPVQSGRCAAAAILCAAQGDVERAEALLQDTAAQTPALLPGTQKAVQDILAGKHPQFCILPADPAEIEAFWRWFTDEEQHLALLLEQDTPDAFLDEAGARLMRVVPFLEREPIMGAVRDGGAYRITLKDSYATALEHIYAQLLAACPEKLHRRWIFEQEH